MLYSEASLRILDGDEIIYEGPLWCSGWIAGTLCNSFYPINPQHNGVADDWYWNGIYHAYPIAVSSEHPGGANVAMVDGSVRFMKETIDTWKINKLTGLPVGWKRDPSSSFSNLIPIGPQQTLVGVWQKITTRNWGDVVGSADY